MAIRYGGATFRIPEGYKGQCPNHFENEAKHEQYVRFSEPIKGGTIWTEDKGYVTIPDVTGIRQYVCDECMGLGDDCGHHCGVEQVGNAPAVTRHCSCPECHGKPVAS